MTDADSSGKEHLRSRLLARRQRIPAVEREQWSREISARLFNWDLYRKARRVHCFVGVESKGEVETLPVLEQMIQEGKEVYLPKVNASSPALKHVRYRGPESLVPGPYGIPEPTGEEAIAPEELDLILVPLLAADNRKNRLGYGMGYYDRFLARATGVSAGLLFQAFLLDKSLPAESHDIPLDYLITENGVV
ncbi:MAG: 5-formyltetrahydrofolate cyclo-ligase [Balneolaceae bacterium]